LLVVLLVSCCVVSFVFVAARTYLSINLLARKR
jgi:hypothetical protein